MRKSERFSSVRTCFVFLCGLMLGLVEVSASSWHEPLLGNPKAIHARFISNSIIKRIDIRIVIGEISCEQGAIISDWKIVKEITAKYFFSGVKKNKVANARFDEFADIFSEFKGPLWISYRASSDDGQKDEEVTFAVGGKPLADCVWPVVWHSGASFVNKIDLVLVPAGDYGDEPNSFKVFARDAKNILDKSFFSDSGLYKTYYQRQNIFNLWIAWSPIDLGNCKKEFIILEKKFPYPIFDGRVVIHQSGAFRDCATISLGGSGTAFAYEPSIFVHESAHFLFGLADEYPCGGGYSAHMECRNVWSSEGECKIGAKSEGFEEVSCKPIICKKSGVNLIDGWRIKAKPLNKENSIMAKVSSGSLFETMSLRCVERRLVNCSKQCY